MTTENLTLMQAMIQKMDWLETRQKILAQNIANADTPNYRPQDLTPIDFKGLLKSSTSSRSIEAGVTISQPGLAATNEQHMSTGGSSPNSSNDTGKNQKKVYEVAPAGNAVVLEEQLLKMNQNVTDHRFITNLYQKNIEMLKLSLRGQ